MGKGGRRSCVVDIEDEDKTRPTMGNQVEVHRGMAEGGPDHNHQQVPQPGHPLECVDTSTSGGSH